MLALRYEYIKDSSGKKRRNYFITNFEAEGAHLHIICNCGFDRIKAKSIFYALRQQEIKQEEKQEIEQDKCNLTCEKEKIQWGELGELIHILWS